jgi:hypothetical protein
MSEITITLTLNESQARALSWAAENVSRLMMNQFDVLKEICHRSGQPFPDYNEMRDIELHLKQLFSPELSGNAYWGIHSPEINNRARTLFDLHQVIRNQLSWYHNSLGGWTVDYDSLHVTDTTNKPPKVVLDTGDPNYYIYLDFFKRLNHSINQMIDKRGWNDDQEAIDKWLDKCREFALMEHDHILSTNTALDSHIYLTFFNEYIDNKGYVHWKEDS